MDLISKYADKLPGAGEPGVFDNLIKETELTHKYTNNDNVKEHAGETAEKVHEGSGTLIDLMKNTNRLSYFVKDDERVTGAVDTGTDLISRINNVLKKIVNLNCITKLCMLAKLLQKFEELKEELDKYIDQVKGFIQMASNKVRAFLENFINLEKLILFLSV